MSKYCSEIVCLNKIDNVAFESCLSIILKDNRFRSAQLAGLVWALKEPRVEQLFKIGWRVDLLSFLSTYLNIYNGVNNEIWNERLRVNHKAKDLNGWLGINKYQRKEIFRLCAISNDDSLTCLEGLKKIVDKDNLSSLDDETFDEILLIWRHDRRRTDRLNEVVKELDEKSKIRLLKTLSKCILERESRLVTLFVDYWDMRKSLDPNTFPIVVSANDIEYYHDSATSLYRLKMNEKMEKDFKNNLKKVAKVSYDKDDEFVVTIPKEANDLVIEGQELHHCVKSYVSKVANGDTNIVFIRKKNDINKPFFTVEIDNDDVIQQVHGFGNCNANSVNGLSEFVRSWAKTKNLKMKRIDKVR